ncbi:unnamed protein product [Rhizoctonia solani]|uniref:Uncharacterized protein n=1 Tax=Rhizoctonia solani TaxID=456999 RepID=A0A8H3I2R5_9AGAM|nr:unnamed protein product [Rhizoctonia solani]
MSLGLELSATDSSPKAGDLPDVFSTLTVVHFNFFGPARAWLGVLPRDAPDANYREAHAPDHDQRKGEYEPEFVTDVLLGGAFGAVPGVQEERLVVLHELELVAQTLDLYATLLVQLGLVLVLDVLDGG